MKFIIRRGLALSVVLAMLLSCASITVLAAERPVRIDGDIINQTMDYPTGVEIVSVPTCESGLLTLTVDGQVRNMEPGIYEGHAVISVTEDEVVEYPAGNLTHHFRQAVYGNEMGILPSKSVAAAAQNVMVSVDGSEINGGTIDINGDEFNGIYITGGTHTIRNTTITSQSQGIGANDFAGYGAAVMATGENTKMVLDNVNVSTKGVVTSTLISGGGANVVVKNSTLEAHEGTLPEDYQFTTSLGFMKSVPWMLGLNGNCRGSNMIGSNTKETFINSKVTAEGWGVLSVDDCSDVTLTGINSEIAITGDSGYGAYVIGNAKDQFYGCTIDVPDYATILTTTGSVTYDDSTPKYVEKLNRDLDLGLSEDELTEIEPKNTVIHTGRASVMFHGMEASGDGLSANVRGGTEIHSDEAVFLSRGAAAYINVDGADGAELTSETGVITQMVDLDKAVRVTNEDGLATYPGPWTQFYNDYESIEKNENFDVFQQSSTDVVNNFSNISLTGDLYNATTGKILDMGGNAMDRGQNMVVNLDSTTLTGVISAAFAEREKSELYPEDYKSIGRVKNVPCAAINNGVIVSLKGNSVWNVTGECYLTSLTVEDGSEIVGDITLDGKPLVPEAGRTYTGDIQLSGNYVENGMDVETPENSAVEVSIAEPATEAATPAPIEQNVAAEQAAEEAPENSTPVFLIVIGVLAVLAAVAGITIVVKKKENK